MSTIMKFSTLLLMTCMSIAKGQIFGQPFLPYSNFGHNIFPRPNYAGYPSFPPRVISPLSVPRYNLPYPPPSYVPQYFPLYYPTAPGYFPDGSQFGAGVSPVTAVTAGTTTATSKPGTTSVSSTTPTSVTSTTTVTQHPTTSDEDTVSVEAAA